MTKKCFLVGMMILLIFLPILGCSIPKEDHEIVVAERDAAQAELQSIQVSYPMRFRKNHSRLVHLDLNRKDRGDLVCFCH